MNLKNHFNFKILSKMYANFFKFARFLEPNLSRPTKVGLMTDLIFCVRTGFEPLSLCIHEPYKRHVYCIKRNVKSKLSHTLTEKKIRFYQLKLRSVFLFN